LDYAVFWSKLGQIALTNRHFEYLEALKPLILLDSYFSMDFIVGNTQEEKALFPIMQYYHIFANYPEHIIPYYSVSFKQNL
jgi:hypothetical protein